MEVVMKTLVAGLVLAVLTAGIVQAGEPDWNARLDEVRQELISGFSGPEAGDFISVTRRVGGDLRGRVSSISDEHITVAGVRMSPAQLTPESAERVFAAVYADRTARDQVIRERDIFRDARAADERERQVAAAGENAAKREAERQAQVKADQARRRAEADQDRVYAQIDATRAAAERSSNRGELALGGIILLALVVGGLFFLILPAWIAFKRGHNNAGAILALSILLGWTFLGWVAALVWAMTDNVRRS